MEKQERAAQLFSGGLIFLFGFLIAAAIMHQFLFAIVGVVIAWLSASIAYLMHAKDND